MPVFGWRVSVDCCDADACDADACDADACDADACDADACGVGSGRGPVNRVPAELDALRDWVRKLELDSLRATVSIYIDGRLD